VVVTVSGANNPGDLSVTDETNGTYAATYTPTVAGADAVTITMAGTAIAGNPFTSTVGAGVASPAHYTAIVPDGTAGLLTTIVVQERDAYGNPTGSGGSDVEITVSGANDEGDLKVTDEADGTYSASYTPEVAGTDEVTISADDTLVSGSPFASTVGHGVVSPAHSTAIVPEEGKVGEPTTILIQARDEFGNPVTVGGEVVIVTVTGENPTDPFSATDLGDGTYTATYTPEVDGDDKIEITMAGIPLDDSPFKSKVKK
jgi:hypothetical protein